MGGRAPGCAGLREWPRDRIRKKVGPGVGPRAAEWGEGPGPGECPRHPSVPGRASQGAFLASVAARLTNPPLRPVGLRNALPAQL